MTRIFISMILSSSFVFAQSANTGSCPFSNSAFKDLRTSTDALRKKIDLPAKCQEVSNRINSAGEDVNRLVNEIIALKEKNDPEDKKKQQEIAAAIINSLKGLSTTYANAANQNDECGRALLTKSDYMLAITDTVKNLSPVLSLVGGPYGPAAALGANALATISGVFIKLFKSNRQNMTKPEDRQAFLSNSCGLYQLHEGIRTILQGQFNELPMINKALDELEEKLNQHQEIKPAPAKVSVADTELSEAVKELKQRLTETLALQSQFSDVPAIACTAIQSLVTEHNSGQGLTNKVMNRFADMLIENKKAGVAISTTKPVLDMISNLKLSELIPTAQDKEKECVTGGVKWIKFLQTLISMAEAELNRPGRLDLTCLNSNISLKNWQKENEKIKKEYDENKTRMAFLRSFSGPGQEFEMSELLNARNSIANSLLGSAGGAFAGKSPAESWLNEMWRSSEISVKKFNEIIKATSITTMNCNVAESTIFEWFKAKSNIQAAISYCDSFENVIQGNQFKNIKAICSSTDHESLKLQNQIITDLKKEALKITKVMRDNNCSNAITKQESNMWRNEFLDGRGALLQDGVNNDNSEFFTKPKSGWVEQCFDQFN